MTTGARIDALAAFVIELEGAKVQIAALSVQP